MRSLLKDRSIRLFGNGEEQRDHLHVADASRLIRELVAGEATGIVNLATGQSRSFSEIVDIFRKVVPASFQVHVQPRKAPATHRNFDVTKLFLLVPGFRFTPLEEGVAAHYRVASSGI